MLVPRRAFIRSKICRNAKYVSGRAGARRVIHSGSEPTTGTRLNRYQLTSTKASGVAGTQIGTTPPFGTTLKTPRPASIPPQVIDSSSPARNPDPNATDTSARSRSQASSPIFCSRSSSGTSRGCRRGSFWRKAARRCAQRPAPDSAVARARPLRQTHRTPTPRSRHD